MIIDIFIDYNYVINFQLNFFAGSKLVDGLMSSKWAQSDTPYIKSREDGVQFCQKLLEKQLLFGGQKIAMQKRKKEDEDDEDDDEDSKKVIMVIHVHLHYCYNFSLSLSLFG